MILGRREHIENVTERQDLMIINYLIIIFTDWLFSKASKLSNRNWQQGKTFHNNKWTTVYCFTCCEFPFISI